MMAVSGAQIAWICVPPGPHIPLMIEAAIAAGLHAVVEKPWQCSRSQTDSLLELAAAKSVRLAVHYQYCLLKNIEAWRREFNTGTGLRFGGQFIVSRPNRLGIPALDNLGCHLLAIRAYAVPEAHVSEIRCAYDQRSERCVWVEAPDAQIYSVDFLDSTEPVIQRFIAQFEATLDGADFPFDLDFAFRVSMDLARLAKQAS